MNFLRTRRRRPEIMDQPDLHADRHVEALRGLARINFLSRSAGILWPALVELARAMAPQVPRVLDVATGGGDVPIRLWRRARRAGFELRLEGCDINSVALEYARTRAAEVNAPIRFFVHDALGDLPVPTLAQGATGYDAIICSLFLHHLEEAQAIALLRRMADMARRIVLVNDLERRWTGLLAAHLATRLLSRSSVVHVDGPRSVEGAFTPAEARTLAERAGLCGARVERRWPFRWLLTWRRA
ncbi:MAG: methyltransferase domain-containing protein [Gemmataceae bacterium]